MDSERRRLLEMAADFLMEEGDDELTRRQLIAFLDDPKNAAKLEEVRLELIIEERISGEIDLDVFDEPRGPEPRVHTDGPPATRQSVRRPNVLRRAVARALRWNARRLRSR